MVVGGHRGPIRGDGGGDSRSRSLDVKKIVSRVIKKRKKMYLGLETYRVSGPIIVVVVVVVTVVVVDEESKEVNHN